MLRERTREADIEKSFHPVSSKDRRWEILKPGKDCFMIPEGSYHSRKGVVLLFLHTVLAAEVVNTLEQILQVHFKAFS